MDPDKVADALSAAGISLKSDGTATHVGNGELPSAMAINGASDGKGRFYTQSQFSSSLAVLDRRSKEPADEKKPFEKLYEVRESLEMMRKNIETKKVLSVVEGGENKEDVEVAKQHLWRLEYRLGKIGQQVEEGPKDHFTYALSGVFDRRITAEGSGDDYVKDMRSYEEDINVGNDFFSRIHHDNGFLREKFASYFAKERAPGGCLHEVLDLLNLAGATHCNREEPKIAMCYLLTAKILYCDGVEDEEGEGRENCDAQHVLTLFFIAQCCGFMENVELSAEYSGITTLLQLKHAISASAEPEVINSKVLDLNDWVRNVTGLSDYFVKVQGNIKQGYHLLEACKYVIERYKNIDGDGDEVNNSEVEEMRSSNSADVERKMAGLLLEILSIVSEVFLYKKENVVTKYDDDTTTTDNELRVDFNSVIPLTETNTTVMNVDEIDSFVMKGSDDLIFEWGKEAFKEIVSCLTTASKYFVLDGFVSDYADICINRSKAYKFISRIESDDKRKGAMILRRASALEPLLLDLNEQAFLGLHKTLSYEIGSAYLDLLELKLLRIEKKIAASPTGYVAKKAESEKCNELNRQARKYFSHFVKLYIPNENIPSPFLKRNLPGEKKDGIQEGFFDDSDLDLLMVNVQVDDDELAGFLRAHFNIARCLSKTQIVGGELMEGSRLKCVEGVKSALKRFEFVVDFVRSMKKTEKNKGIFDAECDIAKQMIELLPTKISQINSYGARFAGAA